MAKILVLEDDADLRFLNVRVFESMGYQSLGVSSKKDFFEKLQVFDPDAVILDIMLGNDDGREICKELRKTHRQIIVALVSAREDLLLSYQECGANFNFLKPYSLKVLTQTIQEALSSQ